MCNGNFVIGVSTNNQCREKVLKGTAEVVQPTTVYAFTSQGLQKQDMGMDLYNSSLVARAVWDSTDAHLISAYSFSIVEIIRENPKEKTIHFSSIKGQAIHKHYMKMTYNMMNKDGNIKSLPLFADISFHTLQYTFTHPNGLLFTTQLAQIALIVMSHIAFEDICLKGLVQLHAAFASHLLGEFFALVAIVDILPNSSLIDIIFYCGLTMQHTVECDKQGGLNYAMCTINPSRVGKTFNDTALYEIINTILNGQNCFVEIMNFNIEVC